MSTVFEMNPLTEPTASARMPTIGRRVFETLRSAIVELRLQPGNSLSEAEVAKQLGTSRQPVREAFIKLSEVGLVQIRPQRGTFVLLISQKAVENARFIREAIEVSVAQRAAEILQGGGVEVLRENLAQQRIAAGQKDRAKFMRLDEEFHHQIAVSIDCEHAWLYLANIMVHLDRVRFLSLPSTTPTDKLVEQHQEILDAIISGSANRAEAAMRDHLAEIIASLPRIVAAHPELFVE